MQVQFARFTKEELEVVSQIVSRALGFGMYADSLQCHMDISATCATCPLDLDKLNGFDDFNFLHDMRGIKVYLNRKTGCLTEQFLPRCAKGETR